LHELTNSLFITLTGNVILCGLTGRVVKYFVPSII